jgi:PTS system nitrogen regulatory IIA component
VKLTVREAARLLSISEAEIYKLVDADDIPVRVVKHQHLFDRAELLEWATSRHLAMTSDLFAETNRPVSLASSIAAGGVHRDVAGVDRAAVLRSVVERLPVPDEDREVVLSILIAREADVSTGIGRGIAIPHVRSPLVIAGEPSAIAVCYLKQPVEFGAIDDKPVHTVFGMISPTIRTHLRLLSQLSIALHDPGFVAAVGRHAGVDDLVAEARRVEAALPSRQLEDDSDEGVDEES